MIGCKRDPEGNTIGIDNAQPVLYNRRYVVDFGDDDITNLTEYFIAELIYAQVDLEGNDIFLMDCVVDYRRNEHALTTQDQKNMFKGRPSLRRSTGGLLVLIQWKD